jgi:HEAT repeat protein
MVGGWFLYRWLNAPLVQVPAAPSLLTEENLRNPVSPFSEEDERTVHWETYREAQLLAKACQERPLTPAEIERVLALADFRPMFDVRAKALTILGTVRDETAREKIIAKMSEHLKDPERVVRMYAITGLGDLKAKEKAPEIVPFLNSTDAEEVSAARRSLRRLGYHVPTRP